MDNIQKCELITGESKMERFMFTQIKARKEF